MEMNFLNSGIMVTLYCFSTQAHTILKQRGQRFLTNWYPGPVSYSANFNAGEEYFLRITPKLDSAMFIGTVATMTGSATITPVSKQQALTELTDTKLVYKTDL